MSQVKGKFEQVKVVGAATRGGQAIMEIHFYNDKNNRVGHKFISVYELLHKGVIENDKDKSGAEVWLNTPEGLKWAEEAEHQQLRRD